MAQDNIIAELADKEYEHGFVTELEQEFIPKGLSEDIIRMISAKRKNRNGCLSSGSTHFADGRRWRCPSGLTLIFRRLIFRI